MKKTEALGDAVANVDREGELSLPRQAIRRRVGVLNEQLKRNTDEAGRTRILHELDDLKKRDAVMARCDRLKLDEEPNHSCATEAIKIANVASCTGNSDEITEVIERLESYTWMIDHLREMLAHAREVTENPQHYDPLAVDHYCQSMRGYRDHLDFWRTCRRQLYNQYRGRVPIRFDDTCS